MRVLAVVATGPGVVDGARPALDPLDLALVRGDAVFEALRVYAGRPFRLREHLDRLATSAAAVELPLPGGLEELALRAVAEAGGGDAVLRLICTRGPEGSGEPRRGAPVDREGSGDGGPAAFAICTDIPASFEPDRRRGLRLVLLTTAADPLVRAASPWLLPGVKSISYATNMAAQRTARAAGADDAVLVGLGGELLEAPTANLWWRSGHTLFTPSLDLGILAGITRAVLGELAPALGLKVLEGVYTAEDLAAADEAFLSSSTREVMPVVEVDGTPIADGHPGPTATDLQAALRHLATAT
ncbi:MAG TPA: aminotransferase class IV [Actinomycetes bacterium]|jgi:4-amino-4-deoxychorismate lyase|nr:aminotransferase class IV [Actinomycetes bacterium]